METASPTFTRKKQSVELEVETAIDAVVDPTRVSQIVANLLNNASKYSPVGAKVVTRLRRAGEQALIEVVDEGSGIPPEQIARIFDMFTKLERQIEGTTEGLGIGLALSRQLAALHGGTLTADSAGEGRGCDVHVAPADRRRGDRDSAERPTTTAAEPTATSGLRVVVVEDNEDSAEMLSAWLVRLGHTAEMAHTGPDGVALVLATRPDVVLCDLGLPGLEGTEVCQRVLASMQNPPVMVALTGWGASSDRMRTSEAGFTHHLVKPVDPERLRVVLDEIAARSASAA